MCARARAHNYTYTRVDESTLIGMHINASPSSHLHPHVIMPTRIPLGHFSFKTSTLVRPTTVSTILIAPQYNNYIKIGSHTHREPYIVMSYLWTSLSAPDDSYTSDPSRIRITNPGCQATPTELISDPI